MDTRRANTRLQTTYKQVIESARSFTDPDFPPKLESLLDETNNNGNITQEKIDYFKELKWQRLSELYDKHSLFSKSMKAENIKQG